MKAQVNIHLLSTDKKSRIHRIPKGMMYQSVEPFIQDCKDYISYHIYFTLPQSDLEISKIKDGDWLIRVNPDGSCVGKPFKADYVTVLSQLNKGFEKIVACGVKEYWKHNLPSIPQSFIEHYITEYNKGNVIKTAEIELDGDYDNCYKVYYADTIGLKLTSNTKDEVISNPTTIEELYNNMFNSPYREEIGRKEIIEFGKRVQELNSPPSKMYSRDEVIELLYKSLDASITKSKTFREVFEQQLSDWIKENIE
jgi:hypothetical protein